MKNTIYCLFSIENDYNQPNNNLVSFWLTKPSLENLAKSLNFTFPTKDDEITIKLVHLWQGKEIRLNNKDYRIQEIKEMQILDNTCGV